MLKSSQSRLTFICPRRLPNSIAAQIVTALSCPMPSIPRKASMVTLFKPPTNPSMRFTTSWATSNTVAPFRPVRNKMANSSSNSSASAPKAINFSRGIWYDCKSNIIPPTFESTSFSPINDNTPHSEECDVSLCTIVGTHISFFIMYSLYTEKTLLFSSNLVLHLLAIKV